MIAVVVACAALLATEPEAAQGKTGGEKSAREKPTQEQQPESNPAPGSADAASADTASVDTASPEKKKAFAEPNIVIVEDGPIIPPHGTPLISNDAYRVTLGALLDVEIGSIHDETYSIPRARLRSDAVLEAQIPVGMRLEVDVSPFANSRSNLNGPGLLRDAYLRVGVGNKRVINLGEVRIGQQRVPTTAHSLRPEERRRFSQRPLAEEQLLPGRDLGFLYHIDYGAHGWPFRVWLGSFGGGGPNLLQSNVSPVFATRVEGDIFGDPAGHLFVRSGAALVINGARLDQPVAAAIDVTARARRYNFEVAWLLADRLQGPLFAQGALRVEGGLEVLSDFFELRLRHEYSTLTTDGPEGRLTAGGIFTYLDNAFQVLGDVTVPVYGGRRFGTADVVLTFRVWW